MEMCISTTHTDKMCLVCKATTHIDKMLRCRTTTHIDRMCLVYKVNMVNIDFIYIYIDR